MVKTEYKIVCNQESHLCICSYFLLVKEDDQKIVHEKIAYLRVSRVIGDFNFL